MSRLILDVSTVARWTGPAVGIVRVEQELARHAVHRRPDVVLAFYDPVTECLRGLVPRWRDLVLGPDGAIDTVGIDFRRHRPAWRNVCSWRYPALMALERRRLTGSARVAAMAAYAQRLLLGRSRVQTPFIRARIVPPDMALGPCLSLGPADTLLCAGAGWQHQGGALIALQRRHGVRLVALCYDLLPLLHPGFFRDHEIPPFRAYWHAVLPAASRIICNARCVAEDVRTYAAAQGLVACPPDVLPLGYAAAPARALPDLPGRLQAGRYALFVSTIEPRKGHAMLLAAWRRLLAVGVPQRTGFHLVFAGRRGWMVDAVLAELDDAARGASVLHVEGADDAMLERLYHDAAFCVYPSRYEGFGLPIIEAFAHGKAVLASTGGAVPETVAGLSPCLDPLDVAAWEKALAAWISRPADIAVWEARIAQDFRYRTWPDAAERIMQAAQAGAVS